MRFILLATAALLPATSAAAPAPDSAAVSPPVHASDMPVFDLTPSRGGECPPISRYDAMRKGGPLIARKLAELPPADHYKAVYRTIDGCNAPIIAGYGIGRPR